MTLLETISGPRDLDALSPEQLEQLADRDPRVPRGIRVEDRRSPRPEPRRRRDDHRDPPGLRLAARRHRLRHRAPVVRAQAADRAQGPLDAAQDRRPRRLPAALGVRARHRRELARVELAVVGRRHLAGVRDDRPGRSARRRRRRRRRAHGRHDVGGAEQHLRRQHAQARSSSSTTTAARTRRPSAAWRASSTRCAPKQSYRNLHLSSRACLRPPRARPARAFYRGVRGGLHGFLSRFTDNEALYSNLDIKYIGPVDGHDVRGDGGGAPSGEGLRRAR